MDWWEAAPVGFKFDPTDVELIRGYLYPRVRTGGRAEDPIKVSDQVYKKPPWQFCTDLGAFRRHGKYYFFTELKKMNQNRVVRTVGSCGTWHESSSKKIFGKNNYIYNNNNGIIGYKKLLNFKEKGEGKEMKTTDWLMHEFSLPEKETLVLCVIQKKKKKEEMGSAYDTYPEPDPMSFIDLDSTTSAGGDPCPAPALAHDDQALDSEEEQTRPNKKMRSDPTFDDDPSSGEDPCPDPAPAPARDVQALDSEEEETRPSKKMRPDPTFDDDPFSGGDACPAPAPAPAHDDSFELADLAPYFLRELTAVLEASGLPDDESGSLDYVLFDGVSGLHNDVFGLPNDLQTPPFEGDS